MCSKEVNDTRVEPFSSFEVNDMYRFIINITENRE